MRSLRPGWLVFALIASGTLAVGVTGGILLSRYRAAAVAALAEREAILVRSRAHLIGDELAELVQEVSRLSRLAEVDLADGNMEPEKAVLRIARRDTVVFSAAVAVLDASGTVLWAEPQGAAPAAPGRLLVDLARVRGRATVHVAPGEIDVAAPIRGQGAIVAVVGGPSGRDLFGDALRRSLRASGDVSLVLPPNGGRAEIRVAGARPALEPAARLRLGREGQEWIEEEGRRWLVTEATVGSGPLALRLAQAADEVEGPLFAPFRRLEGLVGLATVLAVAVGATLGFAIRRLERAQLELARSRDLAAMGKTAAAIAHEVKNSLNGLSVSLDLLASGRADAVVARNVHAQARAEISRLRDVAEDLTLFAAPPRLAVADLDLADLCRQAAAAVSDLASDCGVRVDVEISGTHIGVRADPGRLLGALVNLARNGVEAMGPGGFGEALGTSRSDRERRLSVAAWREDDGVVVEVRDRGPGLPADVRDHLFEPFVTTKRTGTGLGLAIARRVVEAHGGRLDAAPRDGGGTVFRVWLPSAGPAGRRAVAAAAATG